MNDITKANIDQKLELEEDKQVLINNDLPGPVRNTWTTIKDKELLLIQEKKVHNIYTSEYQFRDFRLNIINFINYTWQDLKNYNLPSDILGLFKKRLERLYKLI